MNFYMKKPCHVPPSVEFQTKNLRAQFWAFVDELLGSKKLVSTYTSYKQKFMVLLLFHRDPRHCSFIEILPLFFDLEHNFGQ
jgi:hypothetical protein